MKQLKRLYIYSFSGLVLGGVVAWFLEGLLVLLPESVNIFLLILIHFTFISLGIWLYGIRNTREIKALQIVHAKNKLEYSVKVTHYFNGAEVKTGINLAGAAKDKANRVVVADDLIQVALLIANSKSGLY